MLFVLHLARKSMGLFIAVLFTLTAVACTDTSAPNIGGPMVNTGAAVPVALLVPGGSGQASDELLARSLVNAANLAIADLGGVKIDLRVYNTAGSPAQAQAMALKAVDDGAKIIIGPVFAQEANAAGVAVAGAGINVLSFSNNPDIAGGNVFILGTTFDTVAQRLASYAVRNGKSKVMIVHDQNVAGDLGRAAIERGVASAGGSIVAVASYEFSQNGVVQATQTIVEQAKSSGADAIFLTPDPAGSLALVTQMLTENGLNPQNTRFIGLARWDFPAETRTLAGLQGGWFALPDPALYQQFEAHYSAAYGEPPHAIAGLAYDGIAAIGALVRQGKSDALTTAALTQGAGFVGVNGIFRFRSDGTAERGLAVAQIQNNQIVVIEAAPRTFAGAGS